MAHFSTQIRINATKEKVWEVLADFGGIYRWNPGVRHSYATSEAGHGLLATRHTGRVSWSISTRQTCRCTEM